MNNRLFPTLKTVSVALVLISGAAHAAAAPGSLQAWQQAKYPLLFPSGTAQPQTRQSADTAAPDLLQAWHQAKFAWLKRGTHADGMDASAPIPGVLEAWRQAKYPALSKR